MRKISWETFSHLSAPSPLSLVDRTVSTQERVVDRVPHVRQSPKTWRLRSHSLTHLVFVTEWFVFTFFSFLSPIKSGLVLCSQQRVRSVAWNMEKHRRILTLRPVLSLTPL